MRDWRQRRRLSQLDLAIEADVSARHVSFIETGRSAPSRDMVLRLAGVLEVPLREQNQLLMAAGLAPVYRERPLEDPDMAAVRDGIERVLNAYNPFPCVVVDRGWQIVHANAGAAVLLDGVAPHLLERPNALRIAVHPEGMAPRIRNLGQWRHHLIEPLGAGAPSPDRRAGRGGLRQRFSRAVCAARRDRVLSGRFRGHPPIRRRRSPT